MIHWELCKKVKCYLKKSGICTTQNPSKSIRLTNLSGILRCKWSSNLDQTSKPSDSQQKQKKRNSWIVDFTVPADHRVNLKEEKIRDNYQDVDRKLKKHEGDSDTNCIWCSWNDSQSNWTTMKSLDKQRISTIQQYLNQQEYWGESWRLEETCCHSESSEKAYAHISLKNS